MCAPFARVVLEIEPAARPIQGRVVTSFRETLPFSGWTSLFATLSSVADALEAGLPLEAGAVDSARGTRTGAE
jgi:hypothetical protein